MNRFDVLRYSTDSGNKTAEGVAMSTQAQSRREFLRNTCVAAATTGALATASNARAVDRTRRNMVFILIDDMRYDSLSLLGHPFLETPHLDSLAKNGMMFDRTFVTTSLCSPSRASFLTSLYAHKHRVLDNSTNLNPELPTFPLELQNAGYNTAFIGKWHMGGSSDAPRPGFDHWVSFRGQGNYKDQAFNINGEIVPNKGYITDLLTGHAVDFLKRERDEPFMLYLSHKAVHADFDPGDQYEGCYAGKAYPYPESMANTDETYRGKPAWVKAQRDSWHGVDGMYNKKVVFDEFVLKYAETMRSVDDSVGRVVEALRESGQLDETLIVFTSDNGFQFGEHGLIDKRTMYEASIRIPMIVHCPELVKPGTRRNELITNVDFAPTFLDAGGLDVPDSMQGQSFLPLLRGESPPWRDAFLYEYFWERSFPQTPTVLGVRTNTHKFMRYHGIWDRYEIYDLENDPEERNNLLGDYLLRSEGGTLDNVIRGTATPEVKELFISLSHRLDALLEETGCQQEPTW